jgi:O-acetyl-ADP-ribose deacetylase (regulator of RNase III)
MTDVIRFVSGNLFDSEADALVNAVNCVGVMGKGIALQFKRAFPAMFTEYERDCRQGRVRLGSVTTFRERGKLIVNFPTKQDWRTKSRLSDVEAGLRALRHLIESERIPSVAVPPLGCGNGGLDWSDVRAAIVREFGGMDEIDIEVYEPVSHRAETNAHRSRDARRPPL